MIKFPQFGCMPIIDWVSTEYLISPFSLLVRQGPSDKNSFQLQVYLLSLLEVAIRDLFVWLVGWLVFSTPSSAARLSRGRGHRRSSIIRRKIKAETRMS